MKTDKVLVLFFVAHFMGLVLSYMPQYIGQVCDGEMCQATNVVFPIILACSAVLLVVPLLVPLCYNEDAMNLLSILCLLELGTALISISMTNFSLGLFCSLISVPAALCIEPTANR